MARQKEYNFVFFDGKKSIEEIIEKHIDPARECLIIDKRTERKLGRMTIGDLLKKFG